MKLTAGKAVYRGVLKGGHLGQVHVKTAEFAVPVRVTLVSLEELRATIERNRDTPSGRPVLAHHDSEAGTLHFFPVPAKGGEFFVHGWAQEVRL